MTASQGRERPGLLEAAAIEYISGNKEGRAPLPVPIRQDPLPSQTWVPDVHPDCKAARPWEISRGWTRVFLIQPMLSYVQETDAGQEKPGNVKTQVIRRNPSILDFNHPMKRLPQSFTKG